jgi:hypothetical protein
MIRILLKNLGLKIEEISTKARSIGVADFEQLWYWEK